jgi:hypothetical protein
MIQKVRDTLKPLKIPIKYIQRPDISGSSKIGISYHFFGEGDELYGDGEGKETSGSVQIDVFSTTDYTNIVKQIKTLMKANKFRFAGSDDSDDGMSSVQYYHKILIFNYTEREVLNNVRS